MTQPFEVIGNVDEIERDRWLQLRRGSLGASDSVSLMLPDAPWGSPMSVYADKIGMGEPDIDNEYLRWGRWQQPLLLKWLVEEAKVQVIGREIFIVSKKDSIWTATLDGFLEEPPHLIPVEAKHTAWKERDWSDGVPEYVMIQVQHQMFVTGAPYAYVVASLGGQPPVWKKVMRDQPLIDEIADVGNSFWLNHVRKGEPPPADGHKATSPALGRMYPGGDSSLVHFTGDVAEILPEYEEKRAGQKILDEAVKEMQNRMKAAIGNLDGGIFPGGEVVTWKVDKHGRRRFLGPK